MERFRKENYENIKSLFEAETGVRLPSRRRKSAPLRFAAAMAAVLAVSVAGAYAGGFIGPRSFMRMGSAAPKMSEAQEYKAESAGAEPEGISEDNASPEAYVTYVTEPSSDRDESPAQKAAVSNSGSEEESAEINAAYSGLVASEGGEADAQDSPGPVITNSFYYALRSDDQSADGAVKELSADAKARGVSMSVEKDCAVTAAADGKVSEAGFDEKLGNYIIIDHGQGFSSLYGYLGEIEVSEGDEVLSGEEIALSAGNVEGGNEIYFELRKEGEPVDPQLYW